MLDCDEAQRILINFQAQDLNANVPPRAWNALYGDLYQLAMVTLCRCWHRFDRVGVISQAMSVFLKWYGIIKDLSGQRIVQNLGIYYGHPLQPVLAPLLTSILYNLYLSTICGTSFEPCSAAFAASPLDFFSFYSTVTTIYKRTNSSRHAISGKSVYYITLHYPARDSP
jgi:hypothetical protein